MLRHVLLRHHQPTNALPAILPLPQLHLSSASLHTSGRAITSRRSISLFLSCNSQIHLWRNPNQKRKWNHSVDFRLYCCLSSSSNGQAYVVSSDDKYGSKQVISMTPRLYDYVLDNVREPEVKFLFSLCFLV